MEVLRPLIPGYIFFGMAVDRNIFAAVSGAAGVQRVLSLSPDGTPQVIPWPAIAALQTVEADLDEAFQRRWRRSHKIRRRGRAETLIAALKAAEPAERASLLLDFVAQKEEAVTLKLGDLKVLTGGEVANN